MDFVSDSLADGRSFRGLAIPRALFSVCPHDFVLKPSDPETVASVLDHINGRPVQLLSVGCSQILGDPYSLP